MPYVTLQAESWLPAAEGELLGMVQRWAIAFSRALQVHLREDGDLEAELQVIIAERAGLVYEVRNRSPV